MPLVLDPGRRAFVGMCEDNWVGVHVGISDNSVLDGQSIPVCNTGFKNYGYSVAYKSEDSTWKNLDRQSIKELVSPEGRELIKQKIFNLTHDALSDGEWLVARGPIEEGYLKSKRGKMISMIFSRHGYHYIKVLRVGDHDGEGRVQGQRVWIFHGKEEFEIPVEQFCKWTDPNYTMFSLREIWMDEERSKIFEKQNDVYIEADT